MFNKGSDICSWYMLVHQLVLENISVILIHFWDVKRTTSFTRDAPLRAAVESLRLHNLPPEEKPLLPIPYPQTNIEKDLAAASPNLVALSCTFMIAWCYMMLYDPPKLSHLRATMCRSHPKLCPPCVTNRLEAATVPLSMTQKIHS